MQKISSTNPGVLRHGGDGPFLCCQDGEGRGSEWRLNGGDDLHRRPISGFAKLLFHATSEPWKMVKGGEKWTGQQFIPQPKGIIKPKKITIPKAEAADTVPAEVIEMLDIIQERRN